MFFRWIFFKALAAPKHRAPALGQQVEHDAAAAAPVKCVLDCRSLCSAFCAWRLLLNLARIRCNPSFAPVAAA